MFGGGGAEADLFGALSEAEREQLMACGDKGEYEQGELAQAAAAYASVAATYGDPEQHESFNANLAGRALLSQARCLAKAGHSDDALDILTNQLGQRQYERAVDSSGRLISSPRV